MTKTQTIKVSVCEICTREEKLSSLMQTCPVCKREYCWSCRMSCYDIYNTDCCKDCADDPKIEPVIKQLLEQWRADRKKAAARLSRMKRAVPAVKRGS
jgi:hypothetical protein